MFETVEDAVYAAFAAPTAAGAAALAGQRALRTEDCGEAGVLSEAVESGAPVSPTATLQERR